MSTQKEQFVFWFCVIVWTNMAHAGDTQSSSFTKHSDSVLTAPESVVTCKNENVCSQLHCAITCSNDSTCKSFSVRVIGDGECVHHQVTSLDVSATVAADVQWMTFEKDLPEDCADIGAQGVASVSGVYTIYPNNSLPVRVRCQLDSGQWWTVIEQRMDDTLSFNRPLAEYVSGFGTPENSYWLGLDLIHAMTSSATHELKAKIDAYDGNRYYAVYSGFSVDSPTADYALRYQAFKEGNAGDALSSFKDARFAGNDYVDDCGGCSSGWWVYAHNGCCYDNPNSVMDQAAAWSADDEHFLLRFRLMIRRV